MAEFKVSLPPKGYPIRVYWYPHWDNRVSIGIKVYPNRDSKVNNDPFSHTIMPCLNYKRLYKYTCKTICVMHAGLSTDPHTATLI